MQLSPDQVTELSRLVEVESFDSPDTLIKSLTDEIHSLRSDNIKFLDERDKAVTELSAAKNPTVELAAKIAAAPVAEDEEILLSRAEARDERIDRLVAVGDMPKFIGERYKAAIRKDGKPGSILLSRDASNTIPIDAFIAMFEGSKLGITPGSKTGAQDDKTVELSRKNPGEIEVPKPVNPYEATIERLSAGATK